MSLDRKLPTMMWLPALIIAAVVSLLFTIAPNCTTHGNRVQAMKTASELQSAIRNYQIEYKQMPQFPDSLDSHGDYNLDSWETDLIDSLLAAPSSKETLERHNRRRVQFFTSRPAKSEKHAGVYKSEDGAYRLNDPWGNPYQLIYDGNGDGKIRLPHSNQNDGNTERAVLVWSWGPNGIQGGTKGKKDDDVYGF